jgi:hypothetical protein
VLVRTTELLRLRWFAAVGSAGMGRDLASSPLPRTQAPLSAIL